MLAIETIESHTVWDAPYPAPVNTDRIILCRDAFADSRHQGKSENCLLHTGVYGRVETKSVAAGRIPLQIRPVARQDAIEFPSVHAPQEGVACREGEVYVPNIEDTLFRVA